jgi:hypothetical protein
VWSYFRANEYENFENRGVIGGGGEKRDEIKIDAREHTRRRYTFVAEELHHL